MSLLLFPSSNDDRHNLIQANMISHLKSVLKKSFSFEGRASRAEYWYYYLTVALMQFFAAIYFAIWPNSSLFLVLLIIAVLTFLIVFTGISVTVRRLHDTNHSGWWFLITFIPLLGILWLFVFLVTAGDKEPNRYGEPTNKVPNIK